MKREDKLKNILWIMLAGGGLIYLYNTLMTSFNSSILTLVLTLVLFTSLSLFLNVFNLKEFIIILSVSGFIVSLTVLFYYGVEEVPYPLGAIVFHLDGILKSLILAFLSSIPLLLLFKGNRNMIDGDARLKVHSPDWEVASADDMQSGQFELQ